jgi:hypothetical protein
MPATATPAEWQTLAARIAAAARRDGIPAADADDIAQDIIARHLEGRFAGRCENTQGVFAVARSVARRAGTWAVLDGMQHRDRMRGSRARQAEGYQFPRSETLDRTGAYPSPAAMAAAAEAKGFPVDRIHAAYGIGPQSLHEAGWTPTVKEQTTSPATLTRCPVGDTDPNPASRLAARERCLAELVALAAGSITPRPRTAAREQTAAEQVAEARQAWERFKARNG